MEPLDYDDSLVEISRAGLVFRAYYFPTLRPKAVPLASVARVVVKPATIRNGKWRIHGTGWPTIWFPRDARRPWRDRILVAELATQRIRIGFTVERPDEAIAALARLGVRVEAGKTTK